MSFFKRVSSLPLTSTPAVRFWMGVASFGITLLNTFQTTQHIARTNTEMARGRTLGTDSSETTHRSVLNLDQALFSTVMHVFRDGSPTLRERPVIFLGKSTYRLTRFGYNQTFGRLPFLPGGPGSLVRPPAIHPAFTYSWKPPSEMLVPDSRSDIDKRNHKDYTSESVYMVFMFDEALIGYISIVWVVFRPYVGYKISFFLISTCGTVLTKLYIVITAKPQKPPVKRKKALTSKTGTSKVKKIS